MLETYEAEAAKSAALARLAPSAELAKARAAVHAAKHGIRAVLQEVAHANPENRRWPALMPNSLQGATEPPLPTRPPPPTASLKAAKAAAAARGSSSSSSSSVSKGCNSIGGSLVGRRVAKRFGKLGVFQGVVAAEDLSGKKGLWTVEYEDGDEEDLDLEELQAVLVAESTPSPAPPPPPPPPLPPTPNRTLKAALLAAAAKAASATAKAKAKVVVEDGSDGPSCVGGLGDDDVDVEEVGCSVCGRLESTEENDILLCDRAGCGRAYHMW
jgi:hypothetical protein